MCIPLCTICLCFGFPLSLPGGLLLADALCTAMFLAHSEVVLDMHAAAGPAPIEMQPAHKNSPGAASPGPGPLPGQQRQRQREASRASSDSFFSDGNQSSKQPGPGPGPGEDSTPDQQQPQQDEDDEFAFNDEDIDERAEDIAEEVSPP